MSDGIVMKCNVPSDNNVVSNELQIPGFRAFPNFSYNSKDYWFVVDDLDCNLHVAGGDRFSGLFYCNYFLYCS